MAKRITVEKHLVQKGLGAPRMVIQCLIDKGIVEVIPRSRGDYVRIVDKEWK